MYIIKQGTDLSIQIIVIDNDNNTVDLTDATKVRVSLTVRNLPAYKYLDSTRENPITGYGDVEMDLTNNYQLNLSLTREQTKTFPIGELSATVLLEFPDLVLTDKRVEYTYVIGQILKGNLKDEQL